MAIIASHDEQGGGPNLRQGGVCQIRTAAARDDGADVRALCRSHKRGRGAGAGAEVTDGKMGGLRLLGEPVRGIDEPLCKQVDVKPQMGGVQVYRFLSGRKKIDQ